jgi:hypothetical protein
MGLFWGSVPAGVNGGAVEISSVQGGHGISQGLEPPVVDDDVVSGG